MKTGYTMHSGRCLVSACRRNGTTLVCVTLNCRNDWESHTNLYAYGFDTVRRFFFEGVTLSLPMANAEQRKIEVYSEGLSLLGSSDSRVTSRIYAPECLYPPLSEGSVVGQVEVYLDGKLTGPCPFFLRSRWKSRRNPDSGGACCSFSVPCSDWMADFLTDSCKNKD